VSARRCLCSPLGARRGAPRRLRLAKTGVPADVAGVRGCYLFALRTAPAHQTGELSFSRHRLVRVSGSPRTSSPSRLGRLPPALGPLQLPSCTLVLLRPPYAGRSYAFWATRFTKGLQGFSQSQPALQGLSTDALTSSLGVFRFTTNKLFT
jgi:hypothetical protein